MNNRTAEENPEDDTDTMEKVTTYDYRQARKEALTLIREAFPQVNGSEQDQRARLWQGLQD
jgi:hypothetical protein